MYFLPSTSRASLDLMVQKAEPAHKVHRDYPAELDLRDPKEHRERL